MDVDQVRSFNRTVTERIGALQDSYLSSDRPLGADRVLWEIGDGTDLRALRNRLDLDSGYLSRLIASLQREGLVATAPSTDKRVRAVTLTDAGCSPAQLKLASGPTTFDVSNDSADAVTEFEVMKGSKILGEVENVAVGLHRSFSLTLQPGDYVTNCPGGKGADKGTLTVTGAAVKTTAGTQLQQAVTDYRRYLEQQTGQLVARTRSFTSQVRAGDVGQAKDLYAAARVPYERIEPVAESFGSLDPRIDARAGDVPAAKWTGFHPIEHALWVRGSASGLDAVAGKLFDDVRLLQAKVRGVKLEPSQIANGAVELLGEVSKSKITGEEERYSHIDLVDFEANVAGARAAFEAVAPIVHERNEELDEQIDKHFEAVDTALARYRRGNGFVSYTKLTSADKRKLSQAIDALAEPLSKVPAVVVG